MLPMSSKKSSLPDIGRHMKTPRMNLSVAFFRFEGQ